KGLFVRRDHTQMKRAEIAHRACCCADIERIARAHQHDAQVLEIGRISQLLHRLSAGPPGGVSILREARRAAAKSRCSRNGPRIISGNTPAPSTVSHVAQSRICVKEDS